MTAPMGTVRPMQATDLEAVWAVQAQCYPPGFQEAPEVLAQRWHAAPETAWVAEQAPWGVLGYLTGYRSFLGHIGPLGGRFAPDPSGNALYLHDLAVAPLGRGQGLALRLVAAGLRYAKTQALPHVALVALPEAQRFWQALGWEHTPSLSAKAQTQLNSYGTGASYQVLAVSP